MWNRRYWLRSMAGLVTGTALGWSAPVSAQATRPARLVVIFLRGAVDGLSVVVPHGDADYRQARPGIGLAAPGQPDGVLPLDRQFGLHPALAPLYPLWQQGSLAFVQAVGSPGPSRSHFEAQQFMELGFEPVTALLRQRLGRNEGWLNRWMTDLHRQQPSATALAAGRSLPLILQGPAPVINYDLGRIIQADKAAALVASQNRQQDWFAQLYQDHPELLAAYQNARQGQQRVLSELAEAPAPAPAPAMEATMTPALSSTDPRSAAAAQEKQMADHGAAPANGFPATAYQLARLMTQDPGLQVLFTDLGDWDTHIGQGNARRGRLQGNLGALARGLQLLVQGLGEDYARTTVVVMSEFGRTLHENGTGGTDHGHGNVMWLLGGGIRGGSVYGDWPGLGREGLYQQRDLAVTTDYRAVLALLAARQFGLNDAQLQRIFPQPFQPARGLDRLWRG